MNKDYLEMFNRFFSKEYEISSTYKPVFLSALLDLSHHVRSESYPNSLIEKNDDIIKVQLDFFAVWFIKYYQKIQNLEIKHATKRTDHPTRNNDIDIIGLIENQNITKADFESLFQSRFENFRKEVITKSIKTETLKKLSKDFEELYKIEKQYIIIQIDWFLRK